MLNINNKILIKSKIMLNDKLKINLFCYPTTVVIIDDNQDFLDSLVPVLPHKQNVYKLFNDPNLGERYFKDYTTQKEELFKVDLNDDDEYEIHLKTHSIFQNLYNENRFNQISTVIVDYELNGRNGLEILSKIQDKNMYKILLTGVADENIAIDAFNRGLIDQYVKKQDSYLMIEKLKELIEENNFQFFQRKISNIDKIIKDNILPLILYNDQFKELIDNFIKEYNMIEYYICNSTGNIVFMDGNKNIGMLCVYDEETMHDISTMLREDESYSFLNINKNTKQVICYVEGITTEFSEKSILPARKLELDEAYYYAFANNINVKNLDKIISFNEFRKIYYLKN